jgi:hypothetical protein
MTARYRKRREGVSVASGKSDNTHESEIGKSRIPVRLGSRLRRRASSYEKSQRYRFDAIGRIGQMRSYAAGVLRILGVSPCSPRQIEVGAIETENAKRIQP